MDLRSLPALDPRGLFAYSYTIPRIEIGWKSEEGLKPAARLKAEAAQIKELKRLDQGALLAVESSVQVKMGWSADGLMLHVEVKKPFTGAFYPDFNKGDAFECWIDTRGIKEAHGIHKYCHHFLFLPKAVEGLLGAEITKFQREDRHELASPEDLSVKSSFTDKGYSLYIEIPDRALYGYAPLEVREIRFAYQIHYGKEGRESFPLSSDEYKLENYPALWAALKLE